MDHQVKWKRLYRVLIKKKRTTKCISLLEHQNIVEHEDLIHTYSHVYSWKSFQLAGKD